jgi:hypothetical protein
MDELQSLTSEVARLSTAVDKWNGWRVALAALTAVVAIGLFVVQQVQLRRSRQLATVQAELSKAKDRQLQAALSERDTKISDANVIAGNANKSAAYAHERAQLLERAAADAKTALSKQQERTAIAEQRAADGIAKAAQADANRLKLEMAIMPRTIGTTYIHDDERGLFSETSVFIVYVPSDPEAKNVAREIGNLLARSDWTVLGIEAATPDVMAPAHPYLNPGISFVTTLDLAGHIAPFDSPAIKAARVLAEHLLEQRIAAHVEPPTSGPQWPINLASDALLIKIGPKPGDFWSESHARILQETLPADVQRRLRPLPEDLWSNDLTRETLERNRRERARIVDERRRARE